MRRWRLSLAGLLLTAAVQGVVVALSGSVALLGDTLHNLADALTAVPLLIAFRLGRRPANPRFTYGYGRAEDLAGLFVIAMITLSSTLAAYEAINRLLHPQQVTHVWAVAAAALVGFCRQRTGRPLPHRRRPPHWVSGARRRWAARPHRRIHHLAVLLGALGVAAGWQWADPVDSGDRRGRSPRLSRSFRAECRANVRVPRGRRA